MAEKKEKPAAQETATVRIPRERRDQEDVVVWVNNDRYIIQRGVEVEVPIAIAEILEHAEQRRQAAYDFEASKISK